jgi:hypothetical protein
MMKNLVVFIAVMSVLSATAFADSPPAPSGLPAQKVSGIGGFFFHAKDPDALARWYKEKLGVDPVPLKYGDKSWNQDAGPTAFAPFPSDTSFGKTGQG